MEFDILHQDLLSCGADCIVSPAGTSLGMTSSVAKAIKQTSDGAISRELQRYDPVKEGSALITKGGQISEYILHAVTTPDNNTRPQNVRKATQEALQKADDLACETLAMPALAAGNGGLSVSTSAKVIGEAMDSFSASRLNEAHLVCRDEEEYQAAREIFTQNKTPWVERTL